MQETDTRRSDRASSADGIEGAAMRGKTDHGAFDTSEDCLSESRCPLAPLRECRGVNFYLSNPNHLGIPGFSFAGALGETKVCPYRTVPA